MFNNLLIAAADLNRISLASWDWIVIAIFFLAMVLLGLDRDRHLLPGDGLDLLGRLPQEEGNLR